MSDTVKIEEWYAANIENWYEDIKDFTFKTTFITLTTDEANAICNHFENNTSDSVTATLNSLQNKISQGLIPFASTGAFVKLSCRSPKDVTATSTKMKKYYDTKIQSYPVPTDNDIMCTLCEAHIKVLKVGSAKEAMDLFLQSARIYEDLKLGLQNPSSFNVNVIIREWHDIDIRHEFRGFVCDKKLTCLSQYFDYCYFPSLKDEMGEILSEIKTSFEILKNSVKLTNFICDFALEKKKWRENQSFCHRIESLVGNH